MPPVDSPKMMSDALSSALQRDIDAVRQSIRDDVFASGDLNEALRNARFLGTLNWLNNDGLLSEEDLERALFAKFGQLDLIPIASRPPNRSSWVHVISEADDWGGHTLLLKNLVKEMKARGFNQSVVVTRAATPRFISEMSAHVPVVSVDGRSPRKRLTDLIGQCTGAGIVVSHAHPDDIETALALRTLSETGCFVMAVNHADHAFSYGLGAANVTLEVSGFGWRLSKARRNLQAQSFLGIPVSVEDVKTPGDREHGLVVSMGGSKKYEPVDGRASFPEFAGLLLEHVDCQLELIGPFGNEPWWRSIKKSFPGRIRFIGPIPYREAWGRVARASCYIDSFPMNGGTAFAEALVLGKTVFGVGDNSGYNLAQSLYSRDLRELVQSIIGFLRTGVEASQQGLIREKIRRHFSCEAVCDRLVASANFQFSDPPDELGGATFPIDYYINRWKDHGHFRVSLATTPALSARSRKLVALCLLRALKNGGDFAAIVRRMPSLIAFAIRGEALDLRNQKWTRR